MKKIITIGLLSAIYHISNAQNYVLSPLGIKFPNYTTAARPVANSLGAGTVLYNSTDNVLQFSQGSSWLNFGLPSGLMNQTLRNNGSGWVADGLMQNNGSRILIGLNNYDLDGVLRVNVGNGSTGIYVTSTDNPGIYAQSTVSSAVSGFSTSGTAIYGQSSTGTGITGISTSGNAIYGYSTNQYGVYGDSNVGGVFGSSIGGFGITGSTVTGYGVTGYSDSGLGVYGHSNSNLAIYGVSESNVAVFGYSGTSFGGKFHGRVRLAKGGNGDAGIEFEKSTTAQGGYIGMNGDNEMMIYGFPYGGAIQRWNVNGGSICYATSPTICSDIRLKKDFSNLTNSLASIAQLKGYNYYLRNEKNLNLQTGFIAQEIQKIFPELVNTGSDGYLSVDYTGLIPHLVESVKSLKSENDILKERLLKIENYFSLCNSTSDFSSRRRRELVDFPKKNVLKLQNISSLLRRDDSFAKSHKSHNSELKLEAKR
jgi:Chaperone of endosialidase